MAELNCPKCGVSNPTNRVTCQACHSQLRVPSSSQPFEESAPKEDPPEVTTEQAAPKAKPKRARKVKKQPTPAKDVKGPAPIKGKKEPKVEPKAEVSKEDTPKKRRARRKKAVDGAEFFMLSGGKLQPISVSLKTNKIKPSEQAKGLITLWNRNKALVLSK